MSKKNRKYREHWYSGITEAVQMYVPGNKIYRTMPARRARIGTLFILPLILGFLFFMVRPLMESLEMSLSDVTTLIDYLLTGDSTNMSLNGGDVDGDGDVTIADVTELIDMLLGS